MPNGGRHLSSGGAGPTAVQRDTKQIARFRGFCKRALRECDSLIASFMQLKLVVRMTSELFFTSASRHRMSRGVLFASLLHLSA